MKAHKLFQIVISKAEKGLWWDHDEREYQPSGWGVMFKIFAGPMVRPVTKPRYWFRETPSKWNEFNPEYHLLLRIPFFIGPFISIAVGQYGIYAGFKVFDLENPKYKQMVGAEHVYPGSQAITPSITTRSTRWK